ncbi:ATP-dependent DNA helicase RecG [Thermatribacter velox]|uniref:ATP-dependent DNA helicase RecG n=1 Tax=Thermatribacter velox TaxID=3039681 RepID=A0ABZ2Y848_9BACT
MSVEKSFLQKVLHREKEKLDNLSVIGGFNRFIKNHLSTILPSDLVEEAENYPLFSKSEKIRFLQEIENAISALQKNNATAPQRSRASISQKKPLNLETPVRYLKGVGPALERKLNKLNIKTLEDLIYFFPRTYRDRGHPTTIDTLKEGMLQTVEGKVISVRRRNIRRGTLLKITIGDDTGLADLLCFNQDYLSRILRPGTRILVTGRFRRSSVSGRMETSNFEYEPASRVKKENFEKIVPVYSLTKGLSQKKIRSLVEYALQNYLPSLEETLPEETVQRLNLLPKRKAIYLLHNPGEENIEELLQRRSRAHLTLIFEEFILFALSLKLRKSMLQKLRVAPCPSGSRLVKEFTAKLPFKLTGAQSRVFEEISRDLESGFIMNRLIQGDVGSGKTLVAILSALKVIDSGQQVALMVPTEILAEQHYHRYRDILEELGLKVALIKGGNSKQKAELLSQIAQGKINLIIGTHALLEEKVQFANLGLVIVDEQHRFGVMQRARLKEKAHVPHTLVMTATPIPRTLALTLYGDLDVSVVDEKPVGRKGVETLFFPIKERFKAYNRVRSRIEEGEQAYVVCPAIEESEEEISNVQEIAEMLREKWFKGLRIAIIHGRLPSKEKEEIMASFEKRAIDVLVSTSVIEVGIDVPNATCMVIENAERFGLAQLHQLRGRIGRGSVRGLCILLANPTTEEARQRMKIMTSTEDGFRIAEEDLRLRGPGEFYGVRQHGVPEFYLADPFEDWPLLEKAHQEAEAILTKDPELRNYQNLRREMERKFGKYLDLGEVS